MRLLITGVAGFIGMHVALRFLERGDEVFGIDNLNDYYDVSLKEARLACLVPYKRFRFLKMDVFDREAVADLFIKYRPQRVIHLAAQVGVRYSVKNPYAFINSNLVGFINILEGCRNTSVEHLVYASSSSVYGGNTRLPFSEHDNVDHPICLYAATKKANELMAHSYSYLYGLPTTGLRFFTVYGPWVRPDMALFLFTKAILERKPIEIFNNGNMVRDFTYIDDVVEGILRISDKIAVPNDHFNAEFPDPSTSSAPYAIFNIGNNQPETLLNYINALEFALGISAIKTYLPMQPGDIPTTFADTSRLMSEVNFKPSTDIKFGVLKFIDWYKKYYGV
jgi:UDP-glucuronate 4-epimerase